MAVPKKKTSRARRDRRRANHDRMATPNLANCPECNAPMIPHRACPACGVYRGRQVVEFSEDDESTESG
ncbi:MAG: 50S ribosomal protein L32 [Myxococcota bacterium]|nr:50S ribosomal protein L32 [Myxococcota bacterium]